MNPDNSESDSDSDSCSLQQQLEKKNAELRNSMKKLQEAEERIKEYEEATSDAYDKVDMMEEKLQNEQRCLEQAVRVATRLYSKNSELKTRTIRDRTAALTARRKAWKQAHASKEESVGETHPLSEVCNGKTETAQNTSHERNETHSELQKEEDVNSSDDDLREISALDEKAKSHLDVALERVNELEMQSEIMANKIISLATTVTSREEMIVQLQSIVDEKNAELEELKEKYEMESEVRQSAESYAAKMYGKNKAFQRRSTLLKSRRGESFDLKVEGIMKDVERLTEELEEEKVKRKQEVTILEEKLQKALDDENTKKLHSELEFLQLEVSQLQEEKSVLEASNLKLQDELVAIQATQTPLESPSAPPPPPPPAPAPPPPPPPTSSGDNVSVADLIASRKADRKGAPVSPKRAPKQSTAVDNYANAMEEMMKRITSGALWARNTCNSSIVDQKANTSFSSNSDSEDSADEQEYEQFYSRVGSFRGKHISASGKSATLPILPRKIETNRGNWSFGLKKIKSRISSIGDSGELNKSNFRRDVVRDGSVRHPEGINPDLKKLLEKRRQKIKAGHDSQDTQ